MRPREGTSRFYFSSCSGSFVSCLARSCIEGALHCNLKWAQAARQLLITRTPLLKMAMVAKHHWWPNTGQNFSYRPRWPNHLNFSYFLQAMVAKSLFTCLQAVVAKQTHGQWKMPEAKCLHTRCLPCLLNIYVISQGLTDSEGPAGVPGMFGGIQGVQIDRPPGAPRCLANLQGPRDF
mgnify:CR=1 FL=1